MRPKPHTRVAPRGAVSLTASHASHGRLRVPLACLCLLLLCAPALARQSAAAKKLPSPDKVVGDYVKALGGKKRLAAFRDATYEWDIRSAEGVESRARSLVKSPSSVRTEISTGAGEVVLAVNARTVWRRVPDSPMQTLTGQEAYSAKLQATLGAGRFLNWKKMKVLARTVGVEQVSGEQAYVVEFSTREGARERFWFGASSKLILKTADPEGGGAYLYSDYRPVNGILEAHRWAYEKDGKIISTYSLRDVRHNTGLSDSLFEPPADASLDIPALLRDLARNQTEVDRRMNDYTFTRKVTEREVNDRGELKKEKVTVHEVYPVVGWGWVMKLVSENGVPLSAERAAKEERRVAEELAKAERELPEVERKRERKRAERTARQKRKGEADDEDNLGIATFLRACEFVSPRRERFRDRDTVVFDFRPRPGFKPSSREEEIVSKLSGVAWVDPAERQVMRLEARLVEGFKMGGGLVASIKPGSAFVFEQTRLPEGVWVPRFSQVNASARVFLFAGMTINETQEFSDFKRFSTKSGEDKLDSPKKTDEEQDDEGKTVKLPPEP